MTRSMESVVTLAAAPPLPWLADKQKVTTLSRILARLDLWLRDFSGMSRGLVIFHHLAGRKESSTEGPRSAVAQSSSRTEVDSEIALCASRGRVNFDDFLYCAVAQNVPRYSSSLPPPRLACEGSRQHSA